MEAESPSKSLPRQVPATAPVDSEEALHFPTHHEYHSVGIPSHKKPSFVGARTWTRVLYILVVTLVIAVVILTVTIVQDEEQLTVEESWAPLPPPETTLTSIFFGSCASQKVPQPYWDVMVQLQPNLVVLMGDNVYADCDDDACTNLREAYDEWAAHPSFRGAKSVLPMVAVLDDHDNGQGDCHANNPYKDVAKQMFLDFFDISEDRNHKNDGVYGVHEWGTLGQRVQLILMDTRYSRSPFVDTDEPGPGKESYIPDTENRDKQMLSPGQWVWLEEQASRPADVRLIVSSIQVLSEGNGFEGWRMLPYERNRLTDLLQKQTNTTTVILSGDRHKGGFYRYQNLTEVTASSWTHTIPFGAYSNCTNAQECDEVDERRIGDFVRVNHFGSIEWNWNNRSITISLRRAETSQHSMYFEDHGHLTGDAGEPVQSYTYPIIS